MEKTNDKAFRASDLIDQYIERVRRENNGSLASPEAIRRIQGIMNLVSELPGLDRKLDKVVPFNGDGMKECRNILGYSVTKLADESTVPYHTINRIENDEAVHHTSYIKLLNYFRKRGLL